MTRAFAIAVVSAVLLAVVTLQGAVETPVRKAGGAKIDKEELLRFLETDPADAPVVRKGEERVLGVFRPRSRGLAVAICSRERITESVIVVVFLLVLFAVRTNHYHRRKRIFIQNFSGK